MPNGSTSPIWRELGNASNALLAVALAPACAACSRLLDAPLAGPACPACWLSIPPLSPPLCATCGDPLPSWRTVSLTMAQCARCRRSPSAVSIARAAGDYADALRAIIHAFKYDGRRSLARPLAAMMIRTAGDLLHGADCIIPVPLHPWRRLRRGFNQSFDLALRLDRPVVRALWRPRLTSAQAGLGAAARRRNVRGAFALSPLLMPHQRTALAGATVVLIDDVRTTGATLDACARVLLQAGVREVRALTIARAAPRG